MSVTEKLLKLFRVEQQVRGLRTRLDAAERYLNEQDKQLAEIDARLASIKSQCRQLEAVVANDESEAAMIEARITKLRDQMNSAKTNKEYSTFLSEINTLKTSKAAVDERAIGSLQKLDLLRTQIAESEAVRAERDKVRVVAKNEREKRHAEIAERLEELQRERAAAAKEVPASALSMFESRCLRTDSIDDVMASLEVHDRRRMEMLCGCCQVLLPMEKVNSLLGRGDLATCTSCGCILYIEDATREAVTPTRK